MRLATGGNVPAFTLSSNIGVSCSAASGLAAKVASHKGRRRRPQMKARRFMLRILRHISSGCNVAGMAMALAMPRQGWREEAERSSATAFLTEQRLLKLVAVRHSPLVDNLFDNFTHEDEGSKHVFIAVIGHAMHGRRPFVVKLRDGLLLCIPILAVGNQVARNVRRDSEA